MKLEKIMEKLRKRKIERQLMSCGAGLQVFGKPDIIYPERISIGKNCKLNDKIFLHGRGGITIGDECTISARASIISTSYDLEQWMESDVKEHVMQPVTIGNKCVIYSGAIILPGVTISGEHVIVGAGAVVTKDITESRVLVAGNPARIVKKYK